MEYASKLAHLTLFDVFDGCNLWNLGRKLIFTLIRAYFVIKYSKELFAFNQLKIGIFHGKVLLKSTF